MKAVPNDVRCCVLIRGIRSSTTKEMVHAYCDKYGHVSHLRCSVSAQGIMRGYNVVFKQEHSVNRFMDNRPHRIDGQSVKVRRGIPKEEDWRLTKDVAITLSDPADARHVFDEKTLRDYFCRYGAVRDCSIDTRQAKPCAYISFADYDRVDQLINDKPHTINKVPVNVHKHVVGHMPAEIVVPEETPKASARRCQRDKRSRGSPTPPPPKRTAKSDRSSHDDTVHPTITNDLSVPEPQPVMLAPPPERVMHNEIAQVQFEYERLEALTNGVQAPPLLPSEEFVEKLCSETENLLERIKSMRQKKKTFTEELFEKYTMDYVLSLSENDLKERIEQLEKENQLLLLIKQNMQKAQPPSL